MNHKFWALVLTASIFYFTATNINASVIECTDGAYHTPDGWSVIAEVGPVELQHGNYYLLGPSVPMRVRHFPPNSLV